MTMMKKAVFCFLLSGLFLVPVLCRGVPPDTPGAEVPADVAGFIRDKMPGSIPDREGWAQDIAAAFETQGLVASVDNLCQVLAVVEQESGFQEDPEVYGLSGIARREMVRRARQYGVPQFILDMALDIPSPTGQSYRARLETVRSEKALSDIYDDFTGMLPAGQWLLGDRNPVKTVGPMQVSVDFAGKHSREYPWKMAGTVRQEVFTRRGGLWFGIYHLLNYPVRYRAPLYRFVDYNAGWYSSRNAAFQYAVSTASGVGLRADGDLNVRERGVVGQTERAVRVLAAELKMGPAEIRRQMEKGDGAVQKGVGACGEAGRQALTAGDIAGDRGEQCEDIAHVHHLVVCKDSG